MGCFGEDREKNADAKPAQKWDYINLSDFKSTSCLTSTSYGFLYILLVISIAGYVVDLMVLISLLRFNSWSSNSINSHNTVIPYSIARWIFLGCIIFSWILLVYRWYTAVRAMKSGVIVKSYLDPLAVRIESIRLGKGQGMRRFFVFAKLSSHKKGLEYIALYVYFSFEAWLRILVAEGPRAVIQGLTIYAITKEDFLAPNASGSSPSFQQFWVNVQHQAQKSVFTAVVFCLMVWTTFLWALTFISLCIAALLYIFVLWHQIPTEDGSLRNFCKRRADKSLAKIVAKKITKALRSEEDLMKKRDAGKGANAGLPDPTLKRQPTLPVLGDFEPGPSPSMPPLTRSNTPGSIGRTLTNGSSSTMNLSRQPTLPRMDSGPPRPGYLTRTDTSASDMSFDANAPLLSSPAPIGQAPVNRSFSPSPFQNRPFPPALPPAAIMNGTFQHGGPAGAEGPGRPYSPARPVRTNTGNSIRDDSYGPRRTDSPGGQYGNANFAPARQMTPQQMRPPTRQNTGMSEGNRTYTPYSGLSSPVQTNDPLMPGNGRNVSGLALDGERIASPALGTRQDSRAINDTPLRTGSAMSGMQTHNRVMSATHLQGRASPALMPANDPYSRTMTPGTMKSSLYREDIEMRSQTPRQATPLNGNNTQYTPYSPHNKNFEHSNDGSIERRGTPGTPKTPTQNFSNPLRRPAQPWENQRPGSSRSGTPTAMGLAPPQLGTPHDSIYDLYDRDEARHNML